MKETRHTVMLVVVGFVLVLVALSVLHFLAHFSFIFLLLYWLLRLAIWLGILVVAGALAVGAWHALTGKD